MIKDFPVKGSIRKLLKKPMGEILSEKDFSKKKFENLICIGDNVSETAIKYNLNPQLIVYDKIEMRKPVANSTVKILKKYGSLSFKCKNPAGVLSLDAWKTVENAISSGSPARLCVKGEEDLLALAVLFLAPVGSTLVYGQPNEGIVVVNVTDELKQKYILKVFAEVGKVFLQNLKGTTVIVHDSDTDGCTSAAIFVHYLEQRGLKAIPMVTRDAVIYPNVQRQIDKLQPDNLIILDFGGEAHDYIRSKSRHMKILVVDHHRLKENSEYGRSDIVNPHLFKIPEYLNPPTAYLAYLICDNLDWVGALGVVADKGHPSCPNFLKQMQKKYDVDFEVLKNYTNAADVLRDSEYIVTALLEAKIPQDLLKNKKLVAYEDEFRKEVTRLMDIHKEKARFFEDAKLVIYDIDTKYSLRGGIANTLQEKYKGWTVIIGDEQGDHYAMSLRTTSHDVDLVSTIKKSISTLKDAFGGGHAKASGCKVLLKDKERFIETFIRLLNEINT